MKRIAILTMALLMVSATSVQADLIGEWHLDEGSGTTASDSSGYGNDGTISGATWIDDGIFGSALNFQPIYDWVSFGTGVTSQINSQTPRDYTVAAWIRPASLLWARGVAVSFTAIELGQLGGMVYFRQAYGGWPNGYEFWSGSVLEIGKWTHIVGVFREDVGIDLYVDGIYVGSDNTKSGEDGTASIWGETRAGTWYVGPPNPFGGRWFDGDIDEIHIYNHALTPGEVKALASLTLTVDIDIKPGSYPNAINMGSQGLIPVAILSSADFDATTVDPDTVELAGEGVAVRGKSNKLMAHKEDVNGDGLDDLVCQVATANLDPESLQDGYVVLTGKTYGG